MITLSFQIWVMQRTMMLMSRKHRRRCLGRGWLLLWCAQLKSFMEHSWGSLVSLITKHQWEPLEFLQTRIISSGKYTLWVQLGELRVTVGPVKASLIMSPLGAEGGKCHAQLGVTDGSAEPGRLEGPFFTNCLASTDFTYEHDTDWKFWKWLRTGLLRILFYFFFLI